MDNRANTNLDQTDSVNLPPLEPSIQQALNARPSDTPLRNKKPEREKVKVPLGERAAYTPGVFAALFGKSVTWGYRRIYSGDVKVITGLGGLMMIPASEVERISSGAERLTTRRRKPATVPNHTPAL